jgi:hypothetical protein
LTASTTQGFRACGRAKGGFPVAPLDPFGVHYPHVSGLLFLLVSIPPNWANDAKTRKKVDKKQKNTRKTLDIAY